MASARRWALGSCVPVLVGVARRAPRHNLSCARTIRDTYVPSAPQLRSLNVFSSPARAHSTHAFDVTKVHARTVGALGTHEYRQFFSEPSRGPISPWHDIPLWFDRRSAIFNFVNEMPKGTDEKMEIDTEEAQNPIRQDTKKGALRYIKHGKLKFNYGALPQTWENPHVKDTRTELAGDNDPIDVVELSSAPFARGAIVQVKVLGSLALIDDGETDWKVLAINAADPLAAQWHDIGDVPVAVVDEVRAWYRDYKLAEGKTKPNEYSFDGRAMGRDYTLEVINDAHAHWLHERAPKPTSAA